MNMGKFEYYYGKESEQFSFYRIPKLFFTEPDLCKMSTDAKMLYGAMLDRVSLSARNNWHDDDGKIYIVYTLNEAMKELDCGTEKGVKLFRELESVGLIERTRCGQGKPSKIYVKNFIRKQKTCG